MDACPRCGGPLVDGAGALGEAACGACGARFLDASAFARVREAFLRFTDDVLRDLAREGAPSVPCPACRTTLRAQRVRGVVVDLCVGCGGALLDAGELLALSRGQIAEAAAPAPVVVAPAGPRWIVACTWCDRELDLSTTNWAVNDRPWCAECVESQGLRGWRHVWSMSVGPLVGAITFLAMLPFGARGGMHATSWLAGRRPDDVGPAAVVGRVPPAEAVRAFARFMRRA